MRCPATSSGTPLIVREFVRTLDYAAVNRGQRGISPTRRIDSLMTSFNSLLGQNKFAVPMRRELDPNALNIALDSERRGRTGATNERDSLYFPS